MELGLPSYCDRDPHYVFSSRVRPSGELDWHYLTTTKSKAKKYTLDEAKKTLELLKNTRETIVNFAFIDFYSKVNDERLTDYEQIYWKNCNKYIKEQRKQKIEKLKRI
jgi:hypothetical protein